MSRLWLINGWRQQCTKRKQLLAYLQQAKLLGFDSYCCVKVGSQWWLCCAPLGPRQRQQQDIVIALRQQFAQTEQLLALLYDDEQLICVSWDRQQLLAALRVANDSSGHQQLLLILHGLWQRQQFQPLLLVSSELAQLLQQQLLHGSAQRPFSLAQLQPCRTARLQGLKQPPRWQRWRQLLWLSSLMIGVISALSWYFWPLAAAPLQPSPLLQAPQQLVGMPVDTLLLLREQLQPLDLLAGWQIQQVNFKGGELTVTLQQSYGHFGELQQQLPAQWQLTQSAQQLQLTRSVSVPATALQFFQPLAQALQQLQQQAAVLLPALQWQLGRSGTNSHYQWRDVTLSLNSWYWLELSQLQQLLQGFDVRLLQLQLSAKPAALISIELRIYQLLSQGDDDDSSMDASTSS